MDADRAGSKGEKERLMMLLRFRLKKCAVEWGLILILVICVAA
jgi:hypothetical protein